MREPSHLMVPVIGILLLLPIGSAAQGQRGMMADSTDATTMRMMQPGPRMLLHQRDLLDLSEAQARQLEELQAQIEGIRQEALGVLTEEQRSNVRYGMRMMMRSMGAGPGRMGGMMHGQGGMMGRMGDMERPPMMRMMMQRMHRQMHAGDCPMVADTAGN